MTADSCRYKHAYNRRRGRHLIAKTLLQPGDVILTELPYAAVVYDAKLHSLCDYTMEPSTNLQRCSACKVVRYASRKAQRAAWVAGHNKECQALVAALPWVPPASIRLAARVLWRAASVEKGGSPESDAADSERSASSSTFGDVAKLQDHWNVLDPDRKTQLAQMAMLLRQYMYGHQANELLEGVQPRDVALLLARFACNNHTICDGELRPVGVGVYPTGALVNHSRDFNAVQTFDGPIVRFTAVRPVPAGEEITISYLDLKCTRPERRMFLQRHYHFDIDNGATPLPTPGRNITVMGGACVSFCGSSAPTGLDAADAALTALLSPKGGHMLPRLLHQAHPAAVASTTSETTSVSSAQTDQHFGSSRDPNVALTFWGPGLYEPGQHSQPTVEAVSAANAAVRAFQVISIADSALETGSPGPVAIEMRLQETLEEVRKVVGARHLLLLKLLEVHLRSAVAAGDRWPPALLSAQELLPFYELIYPTGIAPEFGLLWATIAKIAAVLEQDPLASLAAEKAAYVLRICHGGSSTVVKEMMQLRHDIGAQIPECHDS